MVEKQITVELDGAWVLAHRDESILPINAFLEACGKEFDDKLKITSQSLTDCVVILNSEKVTDKTIAKTIEKILISVTGEKNLDGIATFTVSDYVTPSEAETGKPTEEKQTQEKPAVEPTKHGITVDELIGCTKFKELYGEIEKVAPKIIERKVLEAFAFQRYLFSVNDGGGLTTCLTLFADLIIKTGLLKLNNAKKVIEIEVPAQLPDRSDPFESVYSCLNGYGKGGSIICIDISEWLPKINTAEFRAFLTKLEESPYENTYVFRVPFLEEDTLEDVAEIIGDIMFIRTVPFTPLNIDELTLLAQRSLGSYGLSAEAGVWDLFRTRVMEEKSDGRFYGADTVNKIVKEMIYRKQISDAEMNVDNQVIKSDDVREMVRSNRSNAVPAMDKLHQLVGIEPIIEKIEEIITHIELSRRKEKNEIPCIHMRFVGSPGTGKTTVARILGQLMKERGILRNGNFFEYAGRDFCGRYIGETAPKTAAMCRDAYGSVLFIDEAYSLYRGDYSGNDYGREALDMLIAQMENHRNDLVVIMAGYVDEMNELMNGNTGLESRMPYLIEFPNYSREQLRKIFASMISDDYTTDEALEQAVDAYFKTLSDDVINAKSFSNARFVRNLFERTCAKASIRAEFDESGKLVLRAGDFKLASNERSFKSLVEKKAKVKIGF